MSFDVRYNISDFTSVQKGQEPNLAILDSEIRSANISSKQYNNVRWEGTNHYAVLVNFLDDEEDVSRNLPRYQNRLSSKDRTVLSNVISNHGADQRDEIKDAVDNVDTFLGLFAEYPNVRMGSGITNRAKQIMTWRLPNGSSVQMYINPENFSISESKQITQTRTKGGFVVQYWGDNLAKIALSGTTGSSGIKGIQVLRDIYRSENHAFELVAATQLEDLIDMATDSSTSDSNLANSVYNSAQAIRERTFVLRPTLASLALSVMLFYQGAQYRGFFTDFTMTESISKLGLFDYNLSFMVTEIRGSRENFMPWHKEPLADDLSGQLVAGTVNAVGNSLRSLAGLPQQAQNPEQFHPENSPLTFGGSSLTSMFDI